MNMADDGVNALATDNLKKNHLLASVAQFNFYIL